MSYLISDDYLMKWGVRHDPERKGTRRNRVKEGVSAGLAAAGMHYTQGYNPGNSEWSYTSKSSAKKTYKAVRADLNRQSKKIYKDYSNTVKFSNSLYKKGLKVNKQAYKSGKISREDYKDYKRRNKELRVEAREQLEQKMAIGQYKIKKAQNTNKALYYKDIYGSDSKKFKRGMKAVTRSTESYGSYTIRRNSDGSYHITAFY